jgi:hypothetical protein
MSADFVVFMKVGMHASEPIDAIYERKHEEIRLTGCTWWGYGGSLCHPFTQVAALVAQARERSADVYCCFIPTPSRHLGSGSQVRAESFSPSPGLWRSIPRGIDVLGSKYALVLDSLEVADGTCVNLAEYQVAVGPSAGRPVSSYMRQRVDKACARRAPDQVATGEMQVPLCFTGRLASPHAVLVSR